MKKIFIITDNNFIYKKFNEILDERDILIHYYCSPKSKEIFKNEIEMKIIQTISLKNEYHTLLSKEYDLGFSCHSKQIFPIDLVENIKCINIHPGLNPYNRGWFPQVFSILNKYPVGATIHIMDEEIDHGDIIIQEEIEVQLSDTSLDVYNKVQSKELELFEKTIDNIINESYHSKKPLHEGNYNSIQDYKNLCQIDLNKKVTMGEAIDYLRAMTHPPYKNSFFLNEMTKKKYYVSIEISEFNE